VERADAMLVEMQKDKLEKQLTDAKAALAKLKSEKEEDVAGREGDRRAAPGRVGRVPSSSADSRWAQGSCRAG